jgi:hypothetical protein
MADKIITEATQAHADVCNLLEKPIRGTPVGRGPHVVIPDDWEARIARGENVPGCQYAKPWVRDVVDSNGDPVMDGQGKRLRETLMLVTDAVQAKVVDPVETAKLPPDKQADADALAAKVVAAAPVAELDSPKG